MTNENGIGQNCDEAFVLVNRLIDDFEQYQATYLESSYLESNTRTDFIDKFWMALGWDVLHSYQKNPYKQEVRIEKSQEHETGRKRPDYSFYLDPEFRNPKFLVEAKRPGVSPSGIDPMVQAASYGWFAGLPIVVTHNFVELVVIDSRFRAEANSIVGRAIKRFDITGMRRREEFDKLYWLFSREAVSTGSIESFADQLPAARQALVQHGLFQGGYRPVDVELLDSLEIWRLELARALKNKNAWLDSSTLTEITQRILDRLVLIRFLEDKGIETRLGIETIAERGCAWTNFQKASRQLDSVYNGIIFKHHPLLDGSKLIVDDTAFLSICDALDPRATASEYNFAQIPIQILGSIYERFLGKVIIATDRRARIEERPEVVKAGGIYYTPTHVVHYIVDATLNPLVTGKSYADLKKLKIIDTACGSGSFLIAAFDKLIFSAADWFNRNPEKAKAAGCVSVDNGWRLSLAQKRDLLVGCLYGVDLDHQAIEVAQLSLFLKLLEEETSESSQAAQLEIEQAMLPSLAYNIINGNALIDMDFYASDLFPDRDSSLLPTAFKRSFPKAFKDGGFDAVVGNPPYLFITEINEEEKQYYNDRYQSTEYRFDIYGLFIERAITEILKSSGRLGYIIPHTLLANDSFTKLRHLILTKTHIDEVLDIGPGVFQNARNETMVLIADKSAPRRQSTTVRVTTSKTFPAPQKEFKIKQNLWLANAKHTWLVNVDPNAARFISELEKAPRRLGDLCTVNQGLRTGNNDEYLADKYLGAKWERAAGGAEVHRYMPIQDGLWVYYDPSVLDAPRKRHLFDRDEKIVVQEIRNITLDRRIVATLDRKRTFCLQSTNVVGLKEESQVDLRFIMAVVSSSLLNRYFRLRFPANNHIASNQLAALPIPVPTKDEEKRIAALVDRLLIVTERLSTTHAEHKKLALESERAARDEQIERIVCNLFGVQFEESAG